MHIEVLVEDASGARLVEILLDKLFGEQGANRTWRVHSYKGVGHIPKDLRKGADPAKRVLLGQLPRLLQGYGHTPSVDAVVVVVDTDKRDCRGFLAELEALAASCDPRPAVLLFRLAIEEIEAWYFGDRVALTTVYPKAKPEVLRAYVQDSACDTWERLADAIYPGGSAAIKKTGWPLPGQVKAEWARKIGPELDPERNLSPSFCKLRDGLRRLASGH
jgi:hypothetical protein